MDVLSRRLEDIDAILDCPDDTQSVASGTRLSFVSGGSVASGFARRVVTLQQRLDGLESRLREDLTREARKDLHSSIRTKFEKERAMTEARMKEDSDSVGRDIE